MAEHHHFPSRTLEITVLSGEDLRIYRRSVKKNAFVVVRTDTNNFQTTEIDGGSDPSWNEKFLLGLPSHAHGVTLEVHCKTVFGNIIVGAASVPVSDIVGGYVPETHLRFLSYRLKDSRGGRNGIINISVRMKVPAAEECPHWAAAEYSSLVPPGKNDFGGVVSGVPVWKSQGSYRRKFL
ncbi:hypothetical protein TIFTF001_030360 [Ficus carica]|uniref:C2 domain-containing protein n=1 Tax=Ficus carica TaxID=3494 RepID=A0AA88IZJ5_FICCA|nr:hypothetical protein TIFTF001_030360 [Ficus carica]